MSDAAVVCAIALGSNLGDRRGHLDLAVREIAALSDVRVLAVSRWIETDPVGGPSGQTSYLNGALLLETSRPPRELLAALQGIERAHGRRRSPGVRNEPRTLDLDLLTYGESEISEPDLHVPHPRMEERAFVLAPLAEIAPDLVLPGSHVAVRNALARLELDSHGGAARRSACSPP
jgi:2-amino-4-hydroxy-6-hydroxymethyldihydropteridine diphosphokinase